MEISPAERLIILMLCDVHKALKIRRDFDPQFITDALLGGHDWALDWEYQGLTGAESTQPALKETVDILDMWDMIERSYADLSDEDKAKVLADEEVGSFEPKFPGFDGNSETTHMSVATFLVEKLGRWERFRGRYMNSHSPTLDTSDRMRSAYEPLRAQLGMRHLPRLSADEIIQILRERIHPTNRQDTGDGGWTITDDLRARRAEAASKQAED